MSCDLALHYPRGHQILPTLFACQQLPRYIVPLSGSILESYLILEG